jgi:hypothetical protein
MQGLGFFLNGDECKALDKFSAFINAAGKLQRDPYRVGKYKTRLGILQRGPLTRKRNTIMSFPFYHEIGDELRCRPAAASPGTHHLETKHMKTPTNGSDAGWSGCPTALWSGVKAEHATEKPSERSSF